MSFKVLLRKFSSTSTSFCLSKICAFFLDPFLRGILTQQLKNDFEISSTDYAINFKSSLDYNLRIQALMFMLRLPNAMTSVIL